MSARRPKPQEEAGSPRKRGPRPFVGPRAAHTCPVCQRRFIANPRSLRQARAGGYEPKCSPGCASRSRSRSPQVTIAPEVADPALRAEYVQKYRKARDNACARGLAFDLSPEEYNALIRRSGGRCQITRKRFEVTARERAHSRKPWVPSIDRIDNTRGYHADNVRLVVAILNNARGTHDPETFEQLCEYVLRARADIRYRPD